MKRIFLVVLLVFMVGAFYSEAPFVGSAEFEFVANNTGVLEYDGIFTISKGPVSLSIEEYITTDNGVITADYPEFVFDYSIGNFVFEATIANYLGIDFSYKKNFADVFTINPSIYYEHVIIPDVADDGTYGFAFVLSKGTRLFTPINFSAELDGDYSSDWLYTLCLDLSYKVGSEKYFYAVYF